MTKKPEATTTTRVQTKHAHMIGRFVNVLGQRFLVDGECCIDAPADVAKRLLSLGDEWTATVRTVARAPVVARGLIPGASKGDARDFVAFLADNEAARTDFAALTDPQQVVERAMIIGYKMTFDEFQNALHATMESMADQPPPPSPSPSPKVENKVPTKKVEAPKAKAGKGKTTTAKPAAPKAKVPLAPIIDPSDDEPGEDLSKASIDDLRTLAAAAGIDYDDDMPRAILMAKVKAAA